jgi:hypothetical protein
MPCICEAVLVQKKALSTQYIVGVLRANNLTGVQAGIYVYTFDTPGTSNVHVYIGLLID